MKKKRLLMHCCCAPCSTTAIFSFFHDYDITLFYYNPNTYPLEEYNKRKVEVLKLIDKLKLEGIEIGFIETEYDSENFENKVCELQKEKEGGKRCEVCFYLRLSKTAEIAKEKGFDLFATTLTVSPHKNAKLINETGENLSKTHNIEYLSADLKKNDGYKKSVELSKKYDLYRQNYCGCKYSIWW